MNSQSITRRLDALQHIAGLNENPLVKVTFTDGSAVKVPYYDGFTGYIDDDGEVHESEVERRGWAGEVASLSCDNWRYANMVALAAALWGAEYVD